MIQPFVKKRHAICPFIYFRANKQLGIFTWIKSEVKNTWTSSVKEKKTFSGWLLKCHVMASWKYDRQILKL